MELVLDVYLVLNQGTYLQFLSEANLAEFQHLFFLIVLLICHNKEMHNLIIRNHSDLDLRYWRIAFNIIFQFICIIKYPLMGQQQTLPQCSTPRTYHYTPQARPKVNPKIEHEGILKIRPTPFPNCIEISNDGNILFLQSSQTSLFDLLQSRFYTNRLFPLEDIIRLIENVAYTLAFLTENNTIYRDLSPHNIYYSSGQFKLLPNQLIEQNFYQKAWERLYGLATNFQQSSFPYLSPELVIALRMKQKSVDDTEILSKSCVFMFGLILLEATTLMPSFQCYDPQTYDIFNNIVSERLQLVQQHYNQCIARIIANMIDYDFNQRMDLREFSIWINRQLINHNEDLSRHESKKTQPEEKLTNKLSKVAVVCDKSKITQGQNYEVSLRSKEEMSQQQQIMPARNYSRTNFVYINGYQDGTGNEQTYVVDARGAKNSVYLANIPYTQMEQQIEKKIQEKTQIGRAKTQINPYKLEDRGCANKYKKQAFNRNYQQPLENVSYYPRPNNVSYNNHRDTYQKVDIHPYCPPPEPRLKQVINLKNRLQQDYQPKLKKCYDDLNEQMGKSQTKLKVKNQNKFFPSLNEIQIMPQYADTTKRLAKHEEVGKNSKIKQNYDSKQSKQSQSKCSVNDGSINRIKMQIEKSRKLIQQFRKSEGISS